MADIQRCPTCQSELPAGAPAGLCPACLLRAGATSDHVDSTRPPTAGFTPPTPAELAPHFPHLEIQQLVGQGGMGAVYKARQTRLDRPVALKILPKSIAVESGFADRFAREATAMARLSHPNIIAIHDFGEAGGWFFFVMEFVDGANLRQAMRASPISPKDALTIVGEICDALQYAHEEGVVHRDIKPENILLGRKGRVKIADFGLAKLLGTTTIDRHLTATHQVMGTVGYMAPEQMEGAKSIDHRADLYALGVVFYELLTGELPIGRFAPPSQKVQIDVRLDDVVLKTLEKERDRRYQSASQIKQDVERITTAAPMAAAKSSRNGEAQSTRLTYLGVTLVVLGILEIALGAACAFDVFGRYKNGHSTSSAKEFLALYFVVADYFWLSAIVILGGLATLTRRVRALALIGAFAALLPIAAFGSFLEPPKPNLSDVFSELQRIPQESIERIKFMTSGSSYLVNRWPTLWLSLVGIPIGIWGLVTLSRPESRAAFRWDLSSIWNGLYPRYLNSTLLAIVIGAVLAIPTASLDWGYAAQTFFTMTTTWHGIAAIGLIVGATLVMFVSWVAGISWPGLLLGVGFAIILVCLNFHGMLEVPSAVLHGGYYAALWAGSLFSLIGTWQLAKWLRSRKSGWILTDKLDSRRFP